MPEFGVMFKLNANYSRLERYGNDLEETYAYRDHGAKLGEGDGQTGDEECSLAVRT